MKAQKNQPTTIDFDPEEELVDPQYPEFDYELELLPMISKIRELMQKFKYGKLRDELQELVKEDHSVEITVEVDCKTRWNSLLPMLKKFKKLKKYFQIHATKNNAIFNFSQDEIDAIETIILILDSIEETIKNYPKKNAIF